MIGYDAAAAGVGVLPALAAALGVPTELAAAAAQAPRRKSAPIPPLDRRVAAWLLRRRFPPRRIDALAGADDLDAGRAVLPRP